MNNRLLKILTVLLIAAIALPTIPVLAGVNDHPEGSAMWIQPDTLTGPVGTMLEVIVWANGSAPGGTWQVRLNWDDTILEFQNITHTSGETLDWLEQRLPIPNVDGTFDTPPTNGSDTALIGGAILGTTDYVPAGTAGSLCRAFFRVIKAPEKYGVVATTLDLDDIDSYLLTQPEGLDIQTTKYDADYSYSWVLPPSPHMAVDPILVEYGPDPPSAIGEEFDVDIYIMDLEADWSCHNVTFDFLWDDTVIELLSITFDPLWATTWNTSITGGETFFAGDPTSTPFGDVLIVTLRFNVTTQGVNPPDTADDTSPLNIEAEVLWDTVETIPTTPEIDGQVIIHPERVLDLPWLEVSSVTMGPEPSRGAHFNVTVDIKMLDAAWKLTGAEFRLAYPADLIAPVEAFEGPFFPAYAALQPGSFGTWWQAYFEPANVYPAHVLFGALILPNATGMWNPPAPEGNGTIAIIEFEVLYQSYGHEPNCSELEIITQLAVGIDSYETQNVVDIPLGPPVNGTYCITTDLPGRMIDVYGGALNRGYGSLPFPEPFGGQGPHNPMDLVIPQAEVHLFAYVTYNYWPVQNKLVGFEVEGPMGILLKRTAATDTDGYAWISFEMPWPCDDPESLFGVWKVTATVDISDTRLNDTLEFHYDYMINIYKVTTDMFEYNHCDEVVVTIEYGTHAQQMYPALFSVLIMDELIVPVGMALVETEIGGAEFCSTINGTITVSIHIPKWAFAGIATIHVNAYDRDPTEGGVAWTPEFEPPTEIAIQPY
jgi:hypothetical protein